MVNNGETLSPDSYTKTVRLQSRPVTDFIDPGRVYSLFAEGVTIVLQALHRYWDPLAHFCRELELELTHPVQVNVYVTPPHARGLDVHYDTHDVFVLQVSGAKQWKVYDSAVDLPLAHQRRKGRISDPGAPQIEVDLQPGDCLYIPRGFLHAAETAARQSVHMTVGMLTYRWMDVVKAAIEGAGDELFMRDALPPGFAYSPDEMRNEVKERLMMMSKWVEGLEPEAVARSFSDRFWANRPPLLAGQLQQVLSLDSLHDDSAVRRRRGAVCRLEVREDELIVILGDRRLHLPVRLLPVMESVLEAPEFKLAELDAFLDAEGRHVLVRRLIREGLLELASP